MLGHAQRQRLDAHQRVMRRLRVQRHAEVAQPHGDAVEGEGERAEGLVELEPVIGGFGRAERGELVRGRPVEAARIDHHAARHRAVAGEVLGQRMDDQRRAVLDRAAEVWRGRGIVDDQRQARVVGDPRDHVEVGDVAAGVGDALAEDRAGIVVDGGLDRVGVVEVDELRGPAEALDRLAELGDRPAVEPGRDHDVAPRRHQREQRHDLRRVPRRTADSADAAFQRGDAFLQHRHGGVGQAGIDVAHLLQVEERGGVVGVAEHVGRGLVDRHLPRAGGRIGACPGVDLQRVEAVGGALVGHGSSSRVESPGA